MKNKIYGLFFSGLLILSSCNVIEKVDNLSGYSPDGVWNDSKLSNAYLTDLYAGAFSGWPLDGNLSDECLGILPTNYVTTTNGTFKYWPYAEIRDINLMIEGLSEGSTLTTEEKNFLLGQAYFIRAWHYFKALRLHGGIPIINNVQKIEDDLYVTRNTSLESFNSIIKDLDKAAELLEVKYKDDDYGRINKYAVAAFKGRVLLYKASPQFNPTKPYSNSYIDEAYAATKAAKELLESNGYGLVDNYSDIFQTEGHKEAVLPVIYTESLKNDGRQEYVVRPLSESKNGTGGDQPIWNLVEAYPMADGSKIGESTNYTYDVNSYWENRDPRFYADIAYNGSIFELSGKTGRRQYTVKDIASPLDAFGQSIVGESHTRTGLFCRKGLEESLDAASVGLNDVDWLEIRYAEVLFNYAEMANEKGESQAAYDVLVAIRKRAGIEPGTNNLYGLKAGMTKEEMRMAILDEKRIEMAFEGKRFYDLRRHRMLHTYLNGQHKYGILGAYKNPDGSNTVDNNAVNLAASYSLLPSDFSYSVVDVVPFYDQSAQNEMYTPESYYFFPISKSQIDLNPKLEQNDGWGGTFSATLP